MVFKFQILEFVKKEVKGEGPLNIFLKFYENKLLCLFISRVSLRDNCGSKKSLSHKTSNGALRKYCFLHMI